MKKNVFKNKYKSNVMSLFGFVLSVAILITSALFCFTLDKQINLSVAKSNYVNASWGASSNIESPSGSGNSSTDPYLIFSPQHLAYLINLTTTKYAKLMCDIDLAGKNWLPIGYNTGDNTQFESKVNLNGNGYKIKNIIVSMATSTFSGYYVGLYGNIASGTVVQNLTIEGNLSGNTFVGGVAGVSCGAKFYNVHNYASVNGKIYCGGLVGNTVDYESTFNNCYNFGTINAIGANVYEGTVAGGIVGSGKASINLCFNSGSVNAYVNTKTNTYSAYAGGIIGRANESIIEFSSNNGVVKAGGNSTAYYASQSYLGGIAAKTYETEIFDSYNSGSIISQNVYSTDDYCYDYKGGVVGYLDSSIIDNCYSNYIVTENGFVWAKHYTSAYTALMMFQNNKKNYDLLTFTQYSRIPVSGNLIGYSTGSDITSSYCLDRNNQNYYTLLLKKIEVTAKHVEDNSQKSYKNIGSFKFYVNIINNTISSVSSAAVIDKSSLFDKYDEIEGYPWYVDIIYPLVEDEYKKTFTSDLSINRSISFGAHQVESDDVIHFFGVYEPEGGYDAWNRMDLGVTVGGWNYLACAKGECYSNYYDEIKNMQKVYDTDEIDYTIKTVTELKGISSSLGSDWTTSPSVNGGYPVLKQFYWIYTA